MALSVSGFPETSALSQDSEPSTTTTTIRSLFSSNSGNSLATKVSPATSKLANSHISKEEFQQIHDTAQVPFHPPEHLPSVPRPRQVSLTSAGTRRTPPPTASGVRQQYQQLQQRLDLPTNNPPAARNLPGMQSGTHSTHHGLPQPPTVKVHHDWATNSSTAGVSFSSTSSPRPLPTIPMPMPGPNSMATSSGTNSGPIVESSKKAEARATLMAGSSTTQAGPSASSPPGPSSVSVGPSAAASSSARVSTSPSTSRTMPIRTTSSEVAVTASSSLAGPASAIPVSTSPPTVSSPQLPPLNLSMNRRRAQTTAPITHPLPAPQTAAGPSTTRLQSVTTAADLVDSPLSASIPLSAIPPAPSQPPPAVPTQTVAGPRPLPRIPPAGGPAVSTPVISASTPPVASSSKAGAAVGVTYVSGSKTVTTIVAGGSGSSAASSSSSSSSSVAGPSTPKKGSMMRNKRPRTSPGPEASGNNLASLLASGSNTASGISLDPNLSRSSSITRSMASSSSPYTNNGAGPSGSSLSITTSILKRTTSPPASSATPILTSSSTSSSSTRSSPHKDTPPTTGPSSVSLNPILKSLPSVSTPPVAGSSNMSAPPASAPIVPTSGMPPRSRSQSRTRTRVTLPPSPPSHTTTNGQASSSAQPARRTLQLHQPVPVASSSWGAAAVSVGASGSGRITSPPLPPTGSTSTPSGSSGTSASTTHPSLPPIPGNSMMRRGSATAAAIITGSSSTHTPTTTPPTTPGPSRSKPLPSAYGSKHSSTLSSGSSGIPLGQASSMPSIGGRFSSQSHGHGHSHGPLPPRPGGSGAATAAAMLYAAVPCPISPSNPNATATGSKVHSRSNSHTQSQLVSGKPGSSGSNSNSRSASLSRETSLPSLATVAAAGASRSASRSNSKSRANSINTTAPTLPSISTTVGGRPSYKPTAVASPASSPRLGFAPQPGFITASSPITGISHSAVSSPVSPDKRSESPFNASRATSPLGATAAGSRATSPLGARARVRTTSPAGQRLFASSLARKAKTKDWGSDGEDIEAEDGGKTKERGEWMYGVGASTSGAGTTTRSSSVTSQAVRSKQVADTTKEREERRVHIQKEERRMAERRKREEKRQEEKAKVKASGAGREERYRDEEDEPMHEHPTLGRMSSDSELGGTQAGRKRMSMAGNGSRGLDNGELRLMGDGEAFVNDEDYDPILSRSPSPMQYARPGSRSSFSSSIGSSFEQGHTNALSQGLDDDDDEIGYHRARNRNRVQRRNGASVDKTRAAQLLSYRRSYRGPTGPDELSDARPHRSGSASSGRGIASPSPRIHSASPSSSLRHLEGMAGHWKPGIDIGDAEMLEEPELDRSPSPIRYARRNSLDASAIEMIELEQDLADAQGGTEKSRRGTLRARGHSTDLTAREDTRDVLEDYGYGYGGGFERQTDVVEKSAWSDGETLHDKPKKPKKKTKTKADDKRAQQNKPSQLESTLASVGAVLGMGDGDKSPKKEKKEKDRAKAKKEKRKKTDNDGDQTATFGTSSSGSLRTSRGGSSYSNNFAQSVSTLSGSVIDISSLPPTPPQPGNGQPAASHLQEVSMKMQVLGPTGRRGSKEDIGGSLKRLRTYTFDSHEPSSVLGGNPVASITVSRSKTDSKTHKRRSYSQGQVEPELVDDPTDPWSSHWVSKLVQGSLETDPSSDGLTNKAAPPPPEFQPMRKTDSPISFDVHQRVLPSAWSSRKNGSTKDSGDTSSTDTGRSRKTSGASTTRSAANLAKSLKLGPSVPVERKAGRGGGVWVKNSSGSSVQ